MMYMNLVTKTQKQESITTAKWCHFGFSSRTWEYIIVGDFEIKLTLSSSNCPKQVVWKRQLGGGWIGMGSPIGFQGWWQRIQSKSCMPVGRKTVIIVALTDVHIGSQFKENVAFNSRQKSYHASNWWYCLPRSTIDARLISLIDWRENWSLYHGHQDCAIHSQTCFPDHSSSLVAQPANIIMSVQCLHHGYHDAPTALTNFQPMM